MTDNDTEDELPFWVKLLLSAGMFLVLFATITGILAAFVFALRCAWAAGA